VPSVNVAATDSVGDVLFIGGRASLSPGYLGAVTRWVMAD
jgi:hypothetical protein